MYLPVNKTHVASSRDLAGQMTEKKRSARQRYPISLGVVLAVQVFCAVFFIQDVVLDFMWAGITEHALYEASVAIALLIGIGFVALEMRRSLERNKHLEKALDVASGALTKVIETYFEDWGLTDAEAEVALFAIKGFDINEISTIRGTADGTTRAQLTRIYNKAGVANRAQFVSLFIDELIDRPVRKADQSHDL